MSKEAMKLALEAAYLAGFNASGEGYNGEYPFQDYNKHPEKDAGWCQNRDAYVREALAEQPAQQIADSPDDWSDWRVIPPQSQPAPMIRGDIRDGLVDDEPAHQHIEHCLWARNGNQPCPHVQPAQQNAVAWESDRGEIYYDKEDAFRYSDGFIRPLVYGDTPQAQPAQQEPVAWMVYAKDGLSVYVTDNPTGISEGQRALPLYTSPPASKSWVGLTDDERLEVAEIDGADEWFWKVCKAIEAKLRERNNG